MEKPLPNNIELEAYRIDITNPNTSQIVKLNQKTKIEHKKIIGVFCALKGGNQANYKSKVSISINSENIISAEPFNIFLIEKTNSLTMENCMWKLDKEIKASDVNINYEDANEYSSPYTLVIYLVCTK